MSRPKKIAPDYRYHVSGQAVVTFNGTNFYLGIHDTPESQAKYRKLLSEYIASGGETPGQETHQAEVAITVAGVTAEARQWIKTKFANSTPQLGRFTNLCTTLEDEYGDTPANDFGPRKLSELRDLFIASGNCRNYVNTQIRNVVRIFRYALSRELIDASVIVRLNSLESLRYGQTTAIESTKVHPVEIEHVRKTAAVMSPTLRAMVRVQAATAMRPSELCTIRPIDIDMTDDDNWIYRPVKHKNAHRGMTRAVPIKGDARIAIIPFLSRDPEAFCFSPSDSMKWYREQRTMARVTPEGPGRNKPGTNRKVDPKIQPGKAYTKDSYRRAIQRAAQLAKVPHWFPYQLRHLALTEVRDALGAEAAQALAGHSRLSMTEHYAKQKESKASAAANAAPSVG